MSGAVGVMLAALAVGQVQGASATAAVSHPAAGDARTQVLAQIPTLVWKPCGELQCATAKVPLDYDEPDGAKISLALAKRPADKPAQKISSLFINPGGPGGSSVRFVPAAALWLGATVRHRFDIIGVDPRGVGGSTPVHCKAEAGDPDLPPQPTSFFPRGQKQIAGWLAYDQGVRDLCANRGNAILDHMSTADTARDMDLIRQAVGDPMLTYYGISYGTQLGTTYAAMFPSRVRAMIVDGVLDPITWTSGHGGTGHRIMVSARLLSGYGAWEALNSAFAECDRVGIRRCPGAGHVGHEWTRVVSKLKAGAIHVGGSRISYAAVVGEILGGLYDRPAYLAIMVYIHRTYEEIVNPGAANELAAARAWIELKRAVAASTEGAPRYVASRPAAGEDLNPRFEGVTCSDSVNPSEVSAAVPSARYADRQGPGFGLAWAWISSVCITWPGSSDDAYRGPWRTTTTNPLLITGNLHDPATPISGAREVNRLFSGSVMMTLSTWGHGALGESSCVTAKWTTYLVSGKLPDPGLVCKPDQPLFP